MYDRAEEYGIVCQSEPPYEVLYTKWLSYEDVQELKKVEKMLELFYNSGQFTHTLPALQKLFEDPYDMFLSLANFHEDKGFFINNPARSYRYEAILEFAESIIQKQCEKQKWNEDLCRKMETLFRELLTFDLYLREKAKSRPSFAKDIHAYYPEISAFYKKEEKMPELLANYSARGYDSKQMMRMTHMDLFSYPVWDEKWLEEAQLNQLHAEPETFVLFDYEIRDPLNHAAHCTTIRLKN